MLINSIPDVTFHHSNIPMTAPVMYPLANMAYTGSIFMTVLLSVERYVAVCLKQELTIRKTIFYIACVSLFAICFCIPTALVFKYEAKDGVIYAKRTELICNTTLYPVYFGVLNGIFRLILLVFCLVVSNIFIFKEVSREGCSFFDLLYRYLLGFFYF